MLITPLVHGVRIHQHCTISRADQRAKIVTATGKYLTISIGTSASIDIDKMAAYYTFEDYSGTSTPNKSDNPYDGLIENCKNDPVPMPPSPYYPNYAHPSPATNPNHLPNPQDEPQRPAKSQAPLSRLLRSHYRRDSGKSRRPQPTRL
jgi:hypothetical protein